MVGVGPRLDRGKCGLLPHKWVSCGVSPTQVLMLWEQAPYGF